MWFIKSVSEVGADLDSDPNTGLSHAEAQKRLAQYGANEFSEHKKPSIFFLFLDQLKSPLIYILIVAALISLFVGEYSDAVIIVIVILLNAIIGVIQEAKAEKALEELKK